MDVLGVKAALGRQQAEGELPEKHGVYSARHDWIPEFQSVSSFCLRRTAEGEDRKPEW